MLKLSDGFNFREHISWIVVFLRFVFRKGRRRNDFQTAV